MYNIFKLFSKQLSLVTWSLHGPTAIHRIRTAWWFIMKSSVMNTRKTIN